MASIIALTGFMGCGKTTVGQELARRIAWNFIDLDEMIEEVSGMGIPDIFACEGEEGFRARELRALRELIQNQRETVIALGGGTLTQPAAAELVKGKATVVYLEIDAKEAWQRVFDSGRPLARELEQFIPLLESRRPIYEKIADITVSASLVNPKEIAQQILDLIMQGK